MSNQYSYAKLRGRIVEKFGNISNFSKYVSISRTSVNAKLHGKVSFTQKDIVEWANLLDIRVEEYGVYFFA